MLKSKIIIKITGPILWARYSFSPNRLKYCGPNANLDLFERAAAKIDDKKIREILTDFEAAYPYIQFIANENKIQDPFDWRVVEAYWIGNELLDNISVSKFYRYLEDHFGKRAKKEIMYQISGKVPLGAKPYHAFHVLEIYRRLGSLKGHRPGPLLETINNCLVTWGKIIDIKKGKLEIEYSPVIYQNKLILGQPRKKDIDFQFKDKALLGNPRVGDYVSVHWNWACDILTERQLKNLQKWTLWHLKLANSTI